MQWLAVFAVCASAFAARLEINRLPRSAVQFEPNPGRIPGPTQWIGRASSGTLYLSANAAVIELMPQRPAVRTKNVLMRFVGASSDAVGVGLEPTGTYVNHYSGPTERDWYTGIPLFGKVKYSGVYPVPSYSTGVPALSRSRPRAGRPCSEANLASRTAVP